MFASYQLHRSFWRAGLTYGYDISHIVTQTTAATNYFQYIDFSGVYGPNCARRHQDQFDHAVAHLQHGKSSHQSDRRQEHLLQPRIRRQRAGRQREHDRPTVEVKYFHPSPIRKSHILAFRSSLA